VLENGWPAKIPLSIRIVDPEFPASNWPVGACKPRKPRPCTFTSPSLFSMTIPIAAIHPSDECGSAPEEKFFSVEVPSAMAERMAYRWEIDLSPGRRIAPPSAFEGAILTCMGNLLLYPAGPAPVAASYAEAA
jgi:hypothetical protein